MPGTIQTAKVRVSIESGDLVFVEDIGDCLVISCDDDGVLVNETSPFGSAQRTVDYGQIELIE
jgi:hypothetical protein